jgi:hypothetical protein
MTTKQYRTAMGKTVDMGALMLQNESVRAVGNMAVNAKGDKLNSSNTVIDRKSQQINRQNKKQVASERIQTGTSNSAIKRDIVEELNVVDPSDVFADVPMDEPAEQVSADAPLLQGGLAAAIAKAKTVQQTKLPTLREAAKAAGVRKL